MGGDSSIIALGVALFAVLIFGFVSFDRVVRTQYEQDHAAWLEDGKPYGFYWRAKECTWWSSGWAMNRLWWRWLFKTPEWAKQLPTAEMWLRRYRISILAWNIGFLLGLPILLITLSHQ